ncbi:MAG TPA: cation diffusion facilitator family transporter [Acidimicrobiales bacterium]|nr:cation diffusion facilitator family transporter [Acidimicrobiales bacterium]
MSEDDRTPDRRSLDDPAPDQHASDQHAPDHDGHDHGGHDPREHDPSAPGHHHHDHGVSADSDARYLLMALTTIVVFMVGEVIAAILSSSVALLADAGHMLTDAGALGMSFWAARLAGRPAAGSMTFGFKRAEILSAAINGLTLAVIAAAVTVGAIIRLVHPAAVDGVTITVVALVGVADNLLATALLNRASRKTLNVSGALAHLVTDIWAFAGTVVAGIIVITTGFHRADPIASLIVVVLMARASYQLVRASGRVLLEGAPEGVDLTEVRTHILELSEVVSVHDLHAWVVTSDLPAVSAHVVVADACFANGTAPQVLDRLQECLAGHFDVEHSTFQLEPASHVDHEVFQHD